MTKKEMHPKILFQRIELSNKNKEISIFYEKKTKIEEDKLILTARERINELFDNKTYVEFDKYRKRRCISFGINKKKILGDGVFTGFGRIKNRLVMFYAQNFKIFGGTLSEVHAEKICKIYDLALKIGAPIIGISDSGGARIQEGVLALAGYANIFCRNVLASGVIPQISLIAGPAAGGAVYSPALTDFIFMVKKISYMFLTGPDVIKSVTHEDVTKNLLGGAEIHCEKSGVSHFICNSEEDMIGEVKKLLSYIPSNNYELAPKLDNEVKEGKDSEKIKTIIPIEPNKPYDVRNVINCIIDEDTMFEVQKLYAKNIFIGFVRFSGKSVGIVANQPICLAGSLDIDGSNKASRFIRFCDCFNLPIITLVDVPGFLPGVDQEYRGIIKHGAKLLYAYTEATVPKITLILRKAYGGAYCVMGPKHLRGDINYALPTSEIAVMGATGAVRLLNREAMKNEKKYDRFLIKTIDDYSTEFQNPYKAAELGYIDEIILPEEIREKIIDALDLLDNKRDNLPLKKHGNIPL